MPRAGLSLFLHQAQMTPRGSGRPRHTPRTRRLAMIYFMNIGSPPLGVMISILTSQKIPFRPAPPYEADLLIGEGFTGG